MEERRLGWRRAAGVLAATALVVAACQGGSSPAATTVSVIGTWGGDEEQSFLAMVAPFEADTGIDVQFTGTRDINAILTTGVASGVLPDLAGLPGPGQMAEFVKAGALKPLDSVLDAATYKSETAPALVELGTVDGKLSGVFIKAAVKGLIWYNPKVHDYSAAPPATWDDLMSQAEANKGNARALWCLRLGSGAASGWPGTDWIEDIVLRQAGPQVYNDWWAGKVTWSSPEIKAAFQTYLDDVVANIADPTEAVDPTKDFSGGGDPLFSDPPGCVVFHQASFITGLGAFKDKTAGTDYNFFPFPDINTEFAGAVEGAGDLFGMFHDTEAAKSLMKYLVTKDAQDIWVKIGGALSANKNATSYPDDISKRSADLLTNAKTFVFDGSDLMPKAMNDAFWTAMLDVTKDPGSLDAALAKLDEVQATAYAAS
jgi:alpha-glucoside transport system substrate-binding protein